MKLILFFILLSLNLIASQKNLALLYLNSLRQNAGLEKLEYNPILENAAQNHSNYIGEIKTKSSINLMHKEDNINYPSKYYTGETSKKRGFYSGYKSSYYSENLSAGHKTIYASIDGLMSAIYHRYTFLKNNIDEIGIGISKSKKGYTVYNYNMGNSMLDILCQGESFSGKGKYVYRSCQNEELRIEKLLYQTTKSHLPKDSPKYIVWPPKDSENIPPVFFEEFPDPLPNSSVSGYPISIEFNHLHYESNDIRIQDFKLFDFNNNEIIDTLLMNYLNDPNKKHTRFQFTLFPDKRLEQNQKYKVLINYYIDDDFKTLQWSFRTKKLKYPYYKIKNMKSKIKIKSNTSYLIYFEPLNSNDIFKSWSYNKKKIDKSWIKFVDSNTLLIKFNSQIGNKYHIKLSNKRKITLQIASQDDTLHKKF